MTLDKNLWIFALLLIAVPIVLLLSINQTHHENEKQNTRIARECLNTYNSTHCQVQYDSFGSHEWVKASGVFEVIGQQRIETHPKRCEESYFLPKNVYNRDFYMKDTLRMRFNDQDKVRVYHYTNQMSFDLIKGTFLKPSWSPDGPPTPDGTPGKAVFVTLMSYPVFSREDIVLNCFAASFTGASCKMDAARPANPIRNRPEPISYRDSAEYCISFDVAVENLFFESGFNGKRHQRDIWAVMSKDARALPINLGKCSGECIEVTDIEYSVLK